MGGGGGKKLCINTFLGWRHCNNIMWKPSTSGHEKVNALEGKKQINENINIDCHFSLILLFNKRK